jgi:hypothetical protein
MNDSQILTITLATVPNLVGLLAAILINNSRLSDLKADMRELRADMNRQFSDSRDIWRSELHRVGEILDARLKHLEER